MGHEAAAAAKAIGDSLAARSALVTVVTATIGGSSRVQIHSGEAPSDAVEPYVVFAQRSPGVDANPLHTKRCMTSPLYDAGIWVAEDPHSNDAQIGADEIDAALGPLASYSVTTATGKTYQVSAVSEGGAWIRREIDKGKKFFWVGRSYRLSISEA